jgi:broad specificity phosphatase PhoE
MTADIILVRHAMPEVEQGVASKLWGLSEASREDCVLLAHALPQGISAIWSSNERKARETADVLALRLGLPVQVNSRFAEVDRPAVWDRNYQEVAAGYLAGASEPGWEPRDDVLARFSAGIAHARTSAAGTIVVVSHGMALSLWVASIAPIEIISWWRALALPDAWAVDVDAGEVSPVRPGALR